MNYFRGLLLALLVTGSFASAQGTLQADPAHSYVLFRTTHLNAGYNFGWFGGFNATLTLDDADVTNSSINWTVDATTVNTNNERRDEHLNSPDFLDTAQFPEITFASTSVADAGDGNLEVTGDLTMRGVTESITFNAQKVGEATNQEGKRVVGYYAEFPISRSAYGITWQPDVLQDEIMLMVAIEAVAE
ncbi:MAG: YceI family protein [Trueperaceae bacterium]